MAQINCYIPIKLCITGRLSDGQLEELGATVVRTVVARMDFAERTIAVAGGRQADRIEFEKANWEQARYDAAAGTYAITSYQGPVRKASVSVQPGPKVPRDFRVSVNDNLLIATLNGKVVASGWIGDNVGWAVKENYSDNPARYYVTLWINGSHEVKQSPGAISAFREVAENINFYIQRTSRSLQENPLPRRSTNPAPTKKPLPDVAVPSGMQAEDLDAAFLEADSSPPEAYFTANVKKLREHLARGDSDIEDIAIGLTIPELRSLMYAERVRLLRQIAENWIVGDDKERTLNYLIDTTPEPDAARLLEELRANNSELLHRLEDVIDGAEYVQFHEALRRLYLRGMTLEELLSRATAARGKALLWADPPFGPALKEGYITYRVTRNRNGTIHVRRWIIAELAPLDFDPFELVAVYFKTGEDMLGGSKGSVVYLPAENLLLLENKAFKQDLQLAMNVGMVFGGGAGILRATGRVALALAAAELTIGTANIVVDNYKSELEKTPEGKAFLRAWDDVNLVFAAYSAGTAVRSIYRVAPRAFSRLRSAFSAFKATRRGIDPTIATKIDAEMARLLSQTDDVEKAIAADAHGDVSEPPSGRSGRPKPVFVDEIGPPVEPTRTPTAEELTRTIDKTLGESKHFAKWIGPKQAGGKTAAKLGVQVLSDEAFVELRAKGLEGKINAKTRRPFTEQERLEYLRQSRGWTDFRSGKITFPASGFVPGNEIHEGLHQLQSEAFRALGRNISEGATEWYTLIITQEQNIPRGYLKYQDLRPLAADMAAVAGFDNVAEAYFNGDIAKVKAAFEGLQPGLWDKWLKLCQNNRFKEAEALLQSL